MSEDMVRVLAIESWLVEAIKAEVRWPDRRRQMIRHVRWLARRA